MPQQQEPSPTAERTESLPGQRSGACGSAGTQVDSTVGKFLHKLPRDRTQTLGQKALRGESLETVWRAAGHEPSEEGRADSGSPPPFFQQDLDSDHLVSDRQPDGDQLCFLQVSHGVLTVAKTNGDRHVT